MSERPYKTLSKEASDAFVVNKSRFIGYAAPVDTEEEALRYIQSVREQHRDATHHCFAYIIGRNAGIMRYQDDGEPSGTAGQPIMEVLRQKQLVNCCAVVVRYFGGVLLGAGGLVRAYTKGCALAVDAAGVAVMEPSVRIQAVLPYGLWDRVQYQLSTQPVALEDTQYTDQVTAVLSLREPDQQIIETALAQWSDGRAVITELDRMYYAWPDGEDSA